MTDFWSLECDAEHCVDPNPLALPVVPNPGAAGRPECGHYRSSRIRALPVVPLPATTGKASWRLERQHRPRDGDK